MLGVHNDSWLFGQQLTSCHGSLHTTIELYQRKKGITKPTNYLKTKCIHEIKEFNATNKRRLDITYYIKKPPITIYHT